MGGAVVDDSSATPSSPRNAAALARVLELASRPKTELEELGEAIVAHPQLAVDLLLRANSGVSAASVQLTSPLEAVTALGLENIRTLALIFSARGGWSDEEYFPFDVARFWEDSFRRAAAAEALARTGRYRGVPQEQAFIVGLLQDAPLLALVRENPKHAEPWGRELGAVAERRRKLERKLFVFSHDEYAEKVVDPWCLDDPGMVAAIVYHHRLGLVPEGCHTWCELAAHAELVAEIFTRDDTNEAFKRLNQRLVEERGHGRTHYRSGGGCGRPSRYGNLAGLGHCASRATDATQA